MVNLIFRDAHQEDEELNLLLRSLSIHPSAGPPEQPGGQPPQPALIHPHPRRQAPSSSRRSQPRRYPYSTTHWQEYPVALSRPHTRSLSAASVEQYADLEIDNIIGTAPLSDLEGMLICIHINIVR